MNKQFKIAIFVAIFSFSFLIFESSHVFAATYYVSPGGDDNNDGLSAQTPWKSFSRVWRPASAQPWEFQLTRGDTVILMDGTYYESLQPQTPAVPLNSDPADPTTYITFKAQNDGQAIIDGENVRVPVEFLGDYYPMHTSRLIVEGIVAQNSKESVFQIEGEYNILRRVSGYNASTDGNFHIYSLGRTNNTLVEDCIASGSGRKMAMIYIGDNNTYRRCYVQWTEHLSRDYFDPWPWGDGIQIYSGNNNIIENSIARGPSSGWQISAQANGNELKDNKILGSAAIGGGMTLDDQVKYWGCPQKPEPCDCPNDGYCSPADRPQPTDHTPVRDFDWPAQRSGFALTGAPLASGNLFQDIFAWRNAGLGFVIEYFDANDINNRVNRATLINNGVDNPRGPWPGIYGGTDTDMLQTAMQSLESMDNSYVDKLFSDWPDYPNGQRNVSTLQGQGAQLQYRYVDGQLTSEPLWPWPMEDRIQAELGFSLTNYMYGIFDQAAAAGAPHPLNTQVTPAPTNSPTPTPTIAPTPTPVWLPGGIGVNASSFQSPHLPENTLDDDTSTYWSSTGTAEWIQYEFNQQHIIYSIDVTYADNHTGSFIDIQLSSDGQNWIYGMENGATSPGTLQSYDVLDTQVRFVRIVGGRQEGSTTNAIAEVKFQSQPVATPTPSGSNQPCPLPGDTNTCDGLVNILDYAYLSNNFGTSDPGADLNNDGTVNILDYAIISLTFGNSLP